MLPGPRLDNVFASVGRWLTPDVAIALMYAGVIPSLATAYLLWDERAKPGVLWFVLSMATGGLWAFVFATFTAVRSPQVTLVLANFFWVLVPTAAVTLFLLAYEFVFRQTVSTGTVAILFSPVVLLFLLSWFNPGNFVFSPAYRVGPDGFLYFPLLGGPLKLVVTKLYGYLLVFLAAGMFVGEALRTAGARRRQVLSLLVVFSILVLSTMVKVAGLVPVYFDPTSMLYSLSGLLFVYSIEKHGLFQFISISREQAFEEVEDVIVVADPDGVVLDVNRNSIEVFGSRIVGSPIRDVLPTDLNLAADSDSQTIRLETPTGRRHYTVSVSNVAYGRGLTGKILVLSDVSRLKEREEDLDLLLQIFSRISRHNIRNDLNVVMGYADHIARHSDGETAALAEDIREKAAHLVGQTNKVRQIEEIFSYDSTVARSLQGAVREALSAADTPSDAVIRIDVEDVTVSINPLFELAVRELLENAIDHHDGDHPEIDIYTERENGGISLVVSDDGPGIPEYEAEVLRAGRETDLYHSSGIGLWLVRAIVARSNGEFTVEPTENGTRVQIHLAGVPAHQDSPI